MVNDQLSKVRGMLRSISRELEGDGGVVSTDGATREELAAFIREAGAVTWCLGMSIEGAIAQVMKPAVVAAR